MRPNIQEIYGTIVAQISILHYQLIMPLSDPVHFLIYNIPSQLPILQRLLDEKTSENFLFDLFIESQSV